MIEEHFLTQMPGTNVPLARQADPQYKGTNGFADPITALMSESLAELPGALPKAKTAQELRDLAEKRAFVETTLEVRGTYGPR